MTEKLREKESQESQKLNPQENKLPENPESYLETNEKYFQEEWEKLINQNDGEDVKRKKTGDFNDFLNVMSGRNQHPRPSPRSPEEIIDQFSTYKDIKEFIYNLPPEFQATNVTVGEWGQIVSGKGIPTRIFELNLLQRVATSANNSEPQKVYFQLFKDCIGKTDPKLAGTFLDAIAHYGRTHTLTEESIRGFENNLLPALENNDPQVAVLQRSGNVWGMKRGDFGLGDFTCAAYGTPINPKNINMLLMALREVPTSNLSNLEQNRKDALALQAGFGALRDFIHDQRPLVREVIQAMVKYYETHDKSELQSLLPQTEGYLAPKERQEAIYDLSRYDKTRLDILKRLEENTKLIEESPPKTSDERLNEAMEELSAGEFLSKDLLQKSMDIVNSKLETMQDRKEVGIEPNMVLAIAWLERKGYKAVKDMTYEDQISAYTKPWFHSVLKFQELTASAEPFNKEEFDEFIKRLAGSGNLKEAYKLVMNRSLKNVSGLASEYLKLSKPYMTGSLWSGNLAHELIALTDLKPADTIMGKKHRKEQGIPLEFRNTGD